MGLTLDEIARAREVRDIVTAQRALIAVEHGKGEILDIHADAVAHHEHQQQAAEQRQRQPDADRDAVPSASRRL
jgi:hypothetical protein